jgi:hypothetical protein
VASETPLSPGGAPFAKLRNCIFLLFDRLEDARAVCEAKVLDHPHMRCEIFDSKGKALPPLLVFVHPDAARKDEMSASSVRRRKFAAIVLFAGALPLFWLDRRANGVWVVPTFLAFAMILAGLRMLYWNTARGEWLKQEEKRLREHLQREQQSQCENHAPQ